MLGSHLAYQAGLQGFPPVGHQHSCPANAEQGVADQHVALIASVAAAGDVLVVHHQNELVWHCLQSTSAFSAVPILLGASLLQNNWCISLLQAAPPEALVCHIAVLL